MMERFYPALKVDRPGGMLKPCVGRKKDIRKALSSWDFEILKECDSVEEARQLAAALNDKDIDRRPG